MNDEINPNNENAEMNIPIFNILIVLTLIFIFFIPSLLKLNKGLFVIGFIIAVLIMNLLLTFFKVLYHDKSYYTQPYNYNKSHIYNEAWKDVANNTKNGFYYYINATYHSAANSLRYENIKDNDKYFFKYNYETMKYVFRNIVKEFKYIYIAEPKSKYITKKKKYL